MKLIFTDVSTTAQAISSIDIYELLKARRLRKLAHGRSAPA